MLNALVALLFALAATATFAQTPTVPGEDRAALDAAIHDLCGRDIALLGEAYHGDGHTDAFKVVLIERLVSECHFNAVFFEASHYDFLAIQRDVRLGKPVTPEMVSAAVGGLWKFDREFQPISSFLADAANKRQVYLGGLDGQFGTFQSLYENDAMVDELTGYLPQVRGGECKAALHHYIYGGYPENARYDEAARAQVLACVADMTTAVKVRPLGPEHDEHLEMLVNLDRFMRLTLVDTSMLIAGRDHAMYLNLRWLADRLPPHSKVIVWCHNAHAAKDATAMPSFVHIPSLGSYVHEAYGDRAFALGFSAASGAYRYARRTDKPVPNSAPDSLEAKAGAKAEAAYLGAARLKALGSIPAAPFNHEYTTTDWSEVFDAMVVFREEYPPHSTRPDYE